MIAQIPSGITNYSFEILYVKFWATDKHECYRSVAFYSSAIVSGTIVIGLCAKWGVIRPKLVIIKSIFITAVVLQPHSANHRYVTTQAA